MDTHIRRRLRVVLLIVFALELCGLYLAWPHVESFYAFVSDFITGVITYAGGIVAAVIGFKLLVLAKLLINLMMFLLSFVLKSLVAILPEASARFFIKLGIYSGLVRIYNKSQFVRDKWHHYYDKVLQGWQKVWEETILVFWRTIPWPERTGIYLVTGPLLVLPIVLFWIYDWIRLFAVRKTGVLGLESLIRKAHQSEIHKRLYNKAIERFKQARGKSKPA